jgi:hypothetical protein
MSNGKGDQPRPKSVDAQTFADRWAVTLGGSKKQRPAPKLCLWCEAKFVGHLPWCSRCATP